MANCFNWPLGKQEGSINFRVHGCIESKITHRLEPADRIYYCPLILKTIKSIVVLLKIPAFREICARIKRNILQQLTVSA